MRTSKLWTVAVALMIGGFTVLATNRTATAQDAPNPTKSVRGGLMAQTAHYRFEVFFYPTGLRIFPTSVHGTPVDISQMSGSATFTLPGAPQPFVYTLKGAPAVGGKTPESLDLVLDLSKVPAAGARVAFEIVDGAGGRASFTVPFELVPTPTPSPGNGPAAPGPRYTYGQGYYGQGYYPQYERPAPAAAMASPRVHTAPGSAGMYGPPSRSIRDWSTGRDNPIAKPWLRPQD